MQKSQLISESATPGGVEAAERGASVLFGVKKGVKSTLFLSFPFCADSHVIWARKYFAV